VSDLYRYKVCFPGRALSILHVYWPGSFVVSNGVGFSLLSRSLL
jgi:hypothetical protein